MEKGAKSIICLVDHEVHLHICVCTAHCKTKKNLSQVATNLKNELGYVSEAQCKYNNNKGQSLHFTRFVVAMIAVDLNDTAVAFMGAFVTASVSAGAVDILYYTTAFDICFIFYIS
jgi:hypothetical protein